MSKISVRCKFVKTYMDSNMQYKLSTPFITAIIITLCCSTSVFALPELAQIANGDVKVVAEGANLQINQTSDKAIVSWNTFNIGAQESVNFQQPHNGVCLNRIDAANGMSQIAGKLTSTGEIYLINQAGILFADTARVNVGGIIASVADLADGQFLSGEYEHRLSFDQPSSGVIINHGIIETKTDSGLVALLANNVVNDGVIRANLGDVVLGSGQKFTIDFFGDWVLNFAVEEPAAKAGVDENGQVLRDGIAMSGQIFSEGGEVSMYASAAKDVFDNLINLSGEVRATSVRRESVNDSDYKSTVSSDAGSIYLYGDEHGVVKVSGVINASSALEDLGGGEIIAVSNEVVITNGAKLNASGDGDGGIIVLGNVVHLKSEDVTIIPTKKVLVEKGASINVDGVKNGNAGNLIIWSTEETKLLSNVSAKGGVAEGNGGAVNVLSTGLTHVDPAVVIDVSAANGKAGIVAVSKNR